MRSSATKYANLIPFLVVLQQQSASSSALLSHVGLNSRPGFQGTNYWDLNPLTPCTHHRPKSSHFKRAIALKSAQEETERGERKKKKKSLRPGSMAEATEAQGKVPYGESSRQYRRTIYRNNENWVDHRASFGIVANLRGLLFSGVIRQLKNEVLLVTLVSGCVVIWNGFVGNQGTILPHLALPVQPFVLSSPALGLLLVFRTNTSYSRWLEARMKWSTMQTHTVNIARMAATFVDTSTEPGAEALDRLVKTVYIVPRCLMNRFLGSSDDAAFEKEVAASFEGNGFVDELLDAPDRTMTALLELSFSLNDLPLDEKRRLEIDKSIILIGECISSCERIFTSPVPLVYTRHTSRFLSVWMLLLPFPLYDLFVERGSILTPQVFLESSVLMPAVAILSIFLFGVQELSITLEEPFSVLNMQAFCDDIKKITTDMQTQALSKSTLR